MRRLKLLLLGTVVSSVQGETVSTVCPEGWAIGKTKCYKEIISKMTRKRLFSHKKDDFRLKMTWFWDSKKFIPQRLALREAGSRCKNDGGRIFLPESVDEYEEINSLSTDLNLNVNKNFFWVFFKIADPAKLGFIFNSLYNIGYIIWPSLHYIVWHR